MKWNIFQPGDKEFLFKKKEERCKAVTIHSLEKKVKRPRGLILITVFEPMDVISTIMAYWKYIYISNTLNFPPSS